MPRDVARPPLSAVRTFVVAVASGLLVIGLAFEVAVARMNARPADTPAYVPAHIPASCTHATRDPQRRQQTAPGRRGDADTSQREHKGGICS